MHMQMTENGSKSRNVITSASNWKGTCEEGHNSAHRDIPATSANGTARQREMNIAAHLLEHVCKPRWLLCPASACRSVVRQTMTFMPSQSQR
jgi:hypothetical protein